MRTWLLMRHHRIEFDEVQIPLRQPGSLERKLAHSPAGKVPILIDGDRHICEIWRECRARHGAAGDFLFGDFTAADAMFAPVALRFQTYGVDLDRDEAEYAQAILAISAARDWAADARREPWSIARFDQA